MTSKPLGSVAASLLVVLQGCATVSGYTATGSGSVAFRPCVPGMKAYFEFHGDAGVEVRIRAGLSRMMSREARPLSDVLRESSMSITVEWLIREGGRVRLLSPDFLLESPEWKRPKIVTLVGHTACNMSSIGLAFPSFVAA